MYLNITEVDTATVNLAAAFPALCQLITLPHPTIESRTCHALRLGGGAAGSRDCAVIIGGQHAREWGSCEIALNFATDLLEAYTANAGLAYGGKSFTASQVKAILDGLHVLVFPLVNPDGRNHSQTASALWRRNRNTAQSGGNPSCVGVDLNRNYDFLFDFPTAYSPASGVSTYTSTNPCDANQVYHGPSPFSEPETQNVKWLLDTNPRTRWFIDLHSYSQLVLFSWGDDQSQSTNAAMNFQNPAFNGVRGVKDDAAYKEFISADDFSVSSTLANRMRDAILAVRGKSYTAQLSYALYPTSGSSTDYAYSRHMVNPSHGKVYGFTIEWGDQFQPPWAEMEKIVEDISAALIEFCSTAPCAGGLVAVALNTPSLLFNDVPAGVETTRAAVFGVQSCSSVTLDVIAGPSVTTGPGSFGLPLGGGSLPAASSSAEREVRIWVSFTGTSPGDTTTGSLTVRCNQTGETWVIPISANTIAQPKVASVLVLDKSGSMDLASGIPGQRRIDVLHAAAPNFPALLQDDHGIGVVSFDHDAYLNMPVTVAGLPADGRGQAITEIANHTTNPAGLTGIGDGVELAHNLLQPLGGYDYKATVVFTDGEETAAKYISEVAGLINERVFAIGLGTAEEVNPVALNKLVANTGGYLLMTGPLNASESFRLAKYFVQVLAGVTNTDIVVDPDGVVTPGAEIRIPFDLTGADYQADAIVLSPAPWALDFRLETPAGVKIHHGSLGGVVGVRFLKAEQLHYYRMSLPVVAEGLGAHAGRWHVVLSVSAPNFRKYLSSLQEQAPASTKHGVPYSVVIHARSSLNMAAYLTQSSYEPGATFNLRAVLTEIGLPVEKRAQVVAEVKRPDGTQVTVKLNESEPGIFEGSTPAPLNGVYMVRFRAQGKTLRGFLFTREQLRSGLVWRGGNGEPPRGTQEPGTFGPSTDWCGLLQCLLKDPGLRRWLERHEIEPERLEKCFKTVCRKQD